MIRKWVAWLLFVAPLACGAQNIDLKHWLDFKNANIGNPMTSLIKRVN
jgi:hypothetical protein